MLASVLIRLIVLSICLSLLTLLPPWHWLLEWNTGLGSFYLLLHLLSLGCLCFRGKVEALHRLRRCILSGFLFTMCFNYIFVLAPFVLSSASDAGATADGRRLKIFYSEGCTAQEISGQIASDKPDIFVIRSTAAIEAFESSDYPYTQLLETEDGADLAVFSRVAFDTSVAELDLGEGMPRVLSVVLAPWEERHVRLLAFFPELPLSTAALRTYRLLHRRLSTHLRDWKGDLLIISRLGVTPYSSLYSMFTAWSDLRDADWGRGLKAIWRLKPSRFTLLSRGNSDWSRSVAKTSESSACHGIALSARIAGADSHFVVKAH